MPDILLQNPMASPSPAQPLYNLGKVLAKQKKWSEAIEAYRQALTILPHYKIYLALASAFENIDEITEAIECYRQVLQLQPNLTEVRQKLETLQNSNRRIQSPARKISPTSSEVKTHLEKAQTYLDKGEWDAAISQCDRALQIQPNAAQIHALLGDAFYSKRELEAGKKAYLKALELQPNLADVRANLGSIYAELQQPEAAIESYRQATQLDGNQPLVYSNWGRLLLQLKRLEPAAISYQQAIDLDPSLTKAYLGLGDARSHQKQWQEAAAAYQTAMQLDGNSARAAYGLGVSWLKQDRIDDAITSLQKSVELNPSFARAHYQLGNAFVKQNQWEKAQTCYRQAIELDPNQDWAYCFLGDVLVRQEQWSEAIPCYEKAIQLNPNINISVYKNLGEALERANNGEFTDRVDRTRWPYVTSQTHYPKTLPNGRPWPKISIVTPSFNQGEFVEETILSVIHQEYPNLEHLFIDGGSTDDTMEIVERYTDHFQYIVSEPDRGQSHALNKGFDRATGEILTWLNSDDLLAPGALYAAALAFYTSQADMVAGVCQIFQDGVEIEQHLTSCANGAIDLDTILDVENNWLQGKFFYQPEVIFTRQIWEKAGAFVDESLFYSMDYEMWVRFAACGAKLHVIGHPVAQYRMHLNQKTSTIDKYEPELRKTRDLLRSRYERLAPERGQSQPQLDRRSSLRIVTFNDVGYQGGAGIAHQRIAQALALAGHCTIPIAGTLDWSLTPVDCTADRVYERVASLNPDLVIVGNVHNTQYPVEILEKLVSNFTTIFIMHDQWLLAGRCGYVGECQKYTTLCDAQCPTSEEYPPLEPARIASAFARKQALLDSCENLLVLGDSQWTTNWARYARSHHVPERTFGEVDRQFQTIYYGIDLDIFRPVDRQQCRQQLGLPLDKFIILTGSQSIEDERKGVKQLLAALEIADLDDAILVSFGYGSQNTGKIESYGTGYIDNPYLLAYYYSAADIFVGPSQEEAFGQTFVEAAACGTPAIGFGIGGVPEAVRDGICGVIVAQKTPDALAEAIVQLYRDRERLELLGAMAPIYIASTFSYRSSYHSWMVALEKGGWLEKLQLRPASKFAVSLPKLTSYLSIEGGCPQVRRNTISGNGIQGYTLSGFGPLEPPYPHMGLSQPSQWLLDSGGKIALVSEDQKRVHLVLACRNLLEQQVVNVWRAGQLLFSSSVPHTNLQDQNLFTFPLVLNRGVNIFDIETEKNDLNAAGDRVLSLLVEGIRVVEGLEDLDLLLSGVRERVTEKVILMDESLYGTGWFPSELVDGKPVRWMEKVGSVIISELDTEQAFTVRIEGVTAVDGQLVTDMTVSGNGSPIEGTIQQESNGAWCFEGVIPGQNITAGTSLILSIEAPRVEQLSPVDYRRASLLVEKVCFQALYAV